MTYARESVRWIPEGNAGHEITVRVMRMLARRAATDPLLQRIAADNLMDAGPPELRAWRLKRWLEDHAVFEPDPPGTEYIRTPAELAGRIQESGAAQGDCDDFAALGAALAHIAGLESRFVLLGFLPGAPWRHVYTEVRANGEWLPLDPTRPAQLPPELTVYSRAHRGT